MRSSPRVLLLVAALQLASATAFAALVRHPVFDEPNYQADVERYEREGVSIGSLRAHQSASAPLMTVVAGLSGRLIPGELRARRVAILVAWAVVIALAGWLAARSADAALGGALLGLVCFPHVPTSMGSLLTEGPVTAFILASLASTWKGSARRTRWDVVLALTAGVAAGLAILTRQFAMAMAGAIVLAWLASSRRLLLGALASLGVVAALSALLALWGGLTSPASTAPGGPAMHATVQFNPWRPVGALVYVGLYLAPIVPWTRAALLGPVARASLVAALVTVLSGATIWGNGPILSMVTAVSGGSRWRLVAASVMLATAGLTAVGVTVSALWARRADEAFWREPVVVFSAGSVVLFVLEQVGAGGTIPYFERYTFLAFPWAAYLALRVFEGRLRAMQVYALAMALVGQVMLWRHA